MDEMVRNYTVCFVDKGGSFISLSHTDLRFN